MLEHLKDLIAAISEPASAVLLALIGSASRVVLACTRDGKRSRNLIAIMVTACVCVCGFVLTLARVGVF